MDVKRGLRNSILLPTLTYGAENWTWNGAQQSRVPAVEMSYLRGACGVNRWDGLSNESVYERCGMRGRGSGVGCGVVEWVVVSRSSKSCGSSCSGNHLSKLQRCGGAEPKFE